MYRDRGTAIRVVRLDGTNDRVLYERDGESLEVCAWTHGGEVLATLLKATGGRELVAIKGDGAIRRISTRWPVLGCVRVSADGQQIAYEHRQEDHPDNRDISVVSTDGSVQQFVVQHPADDRLFGWSSDGNEVLFTSDRRTKVISLWASKPDPIRAPQGRVILASWTWVEPLGSTVAGDIFYRLFVRQRDAHIASIDPRTGRVLGQGAPLAVSYAGGNTSPDWSPDGRLLSYKAEDELTPSHGRALMIRELTSGQERKLFPDLTDYSRPRWHPDGRSLITQGQKDRRRGAFAIDAASGVVTPLKLSEGKDPPVFNPRWSADGSGVFYESGRTQLRLWNRQSAEERVLFRTNSTESILTSETSPDGRSLAFITTSRNSGYLRVLDVNGAGEPRTLLALTGPQRFQEWPGGLTWSRDSKFVLFSKGTNQQELWRVRVEGGSPEPLGLSGKTLYFLRLHPDGERLLFMEGDINPAASYEVWTLSGVAPQ